MTLLAIGAACVVGFILGDRYKRADLQDRYATALEAYTRENEAERR